MADMNIDYALILANLKQMTGILEFDSMRSAGKCKMNAPQLESMYNMMDRYEAVLNKKPAPAKKEG